MKKAIRGAGPFAGILVSMLRIAVPLVIIAAGAVWVLTYQSRPTGAVRVTTSVPGADIYIAGVQTGFSTDTLLTEVPLGRQLITVRKPGYVSDPEVAIIEVYPDRVANAGFHLRESVKIAVKDSLPKGRPVRQDIFSTGEPVKTIPPAPPSRRMLAYEDDYVPDDSYHDYSKPGSGSPASGMETRSSTQTARTSLTETQITVTSNPEGADIIVNTASTPYKTPYTFNGLDRGVYVFALSKEAYEVSPMNIPVTLSRSGQSELVAFNLKPDDSWPRPIIRLSTEPLAAGIFLDGESVGVGQADVEIEFGVHRVTFAEAAGYEAPASVEFEAVPNEDLSEITGSYIRVTGNAFLAIVPGSSVSPFDGTQLRIYVDNELILDGHEEPYDLTLVGSLLPGNRLIRIEYGELSNDIHVDLSDGDVAEVNFRVESFFSKRKLKLKERRELPLEKWQSRYRNLNILSLS